MKRFILWFMLALASRADWKDTQLFYLMAGHIPCVALTSNKLHGVTHVASLFSGVQIGHVDAVDPSYCTGFTPITDPCGSIANCSWSQAHANVKNDSYLFVTCRPVTNGITYIATNLVWGVTPVVWWSQARSQWLYATLDFWNPFEIVTYDDTSTALYGQFGFTGTAPISGDSNGPCFTLTGEYIGSVGQTAPGHGYGSFSYPSDARTRPVTPPTPAVSVNAWAFIHDE